MALDRKHFDDMDDFGDFDEKIETSTEGELAEHAPNHPLSWRRIMIEKAALNVKKAVESRTDLQVSYKKGELVFDETAHKFGRVVESKPGFLNLSLLAGGKLVRRDMNQLDFVREHRQMLTLKEMAERLVVSEIEVIALLNQLELEADVKLEVKPSEASSKKALVKPAKKTLPKKKIALAAKKTPMPADVVKLPAKKSVKIAAKKKDFLAKKKIAVTQEKNISFTKLLPKGATTDPVMDPNGYIQQNFLMMNNKELALATGLSEHTIRRKLGEWNLKRKDFVNKA
ncbi:MAG TPA: hypothetical protein VEL47_00275 [Myxococcota bacterium]|nr:hypothetical protein [Myxococcota bacterium]